jgi:hypothetical protein
VPWQGLLKTFAVMVATYIMWFKVHFIMLAKTGDRASAFVPVEFSEPYQKTLLNNPAYDVRIHSDCDIESCYCHDSAVMLLTPVCISRGYSLTCRLLAS